jgi:serine/threonine kinase 38
VEHELDTQNFEQFEEDPNAAANSATAGSGGAGSRKWIANKTDPNFIGYTYKNWEAVQPSAEGLTTGVI